MIEDFSGGYYRAEMTVQPLESGPSIERGLYDLISRKIYTNTDAPVTMRLTLDGGPRFMPHTEGAMPTDVIGMPTDMLDDVGIHPSAEDISVFILKPKHAYLFHQVDDLDEEDLYQNAYTSLTEEDRSFFNLKGE
jgi:hypothetical protein